MEVYKDPETLRPMAAVIVKKSIFWRAWQKFSEGDNFSIVQKVGFLSKFNNGWRHRRITGD